MAEIMTDKGLVVGLIAKPKPVRPETAKVDPKPAPAKAKSAAKSSKE